MDLETAARIVGAGSPRRVFGSAAPLKAEKEYTNALGRYKEARRVLESVYLEATCGHEVVWHEDDGVPPGEWDCPEHGRVGLWAQRLQPRPSDA